MPKVTTVTPRGSVIQDLRERNGLSRKQLGKMIGRSHESIRRIEVLPVPAARLLVCQVARALKVDVEELVFPEDAKDEDRAAA